MRPLRLELEGFTTFRDRTVVDFQGADLFALTGNTGSGKSSLIDAIVFVLYGVVPRYDDRRKVAPVLSQGKVEARIGLEFSVGSDTYTAVRVVRRNPRGVTTKEATLERLRAGADSEVLASNADEVTARVAELLGLEVDHFTRCVVLPQGEFARFLLDQPKDRRELLVNLLDLGIYEEMGQRARALSKELEVRVELLDRRLAELGDIDDEATAAAERHVQRTEELQTQVDEAGPRLDDLETARRVGTERIAEATRAIESLDRLRVPDAVKSLADAFESAKAERDAAVEAESAAAKERACADETLESMPRRNGLERIVDAYADRERLLEQVAAAQARMAPLAAAEDAARVADEAAGAALVEAAAHLQDVRNAHLAHTLAETLVAGSPCPVCERDVEAVPALVSPPGKAEAESAVTEATRHKGDAGTELTACCDSRRKASGGIETLRGQLEDAEAGLAGAGTLEATLALLERLGTAEADAKAKLASYERARDARDGAQAAFEKALSDQDDARGEFGRARDGVAVLGPPEPGRDLLADWTALVEWGSGQRPAHATARAEAEAAVAAATSDHDALFAALVERARDAGVEATANLEDLRRKTSHAGAQARSEHSDLVARAKEAAGKRDERTRVERERAVADALGVHLKSNNFQDWLLREALETLVAGATEMLRELSGGAYSFKLADKGAGFDVIDHRNADEPRSARTLSGGETFLASLALALALGDHIASMAAHGAARLESLFLDEGFGTLDADTLDTVAAAIEELGARGRTVGLVTHVRDLAERVPVRFEVVKGPGGSTVTRVDT